MSKPLNLKAIQKEVGSNINSLKAGQDTPDFLVKVKQAKKHLLEIREKLQKHIKVGHHKLNALQRDTSDELRKVKEIAGSEIDKIKMIIREINSALDSFRQTDKNTARCCSFNKDINFMNSAEEKDPLQITYQTIALMDAGRDETANQGTIVNYPNPALGTSANPRDYDIGDKIRMGLSISGEDGRANCRIAIPKCFQNFCGGKD